MINKLKAYFRRRRQERRWRRESKKPKRCIDPCMKYCQECRWGYCIYPEDTTREDLAWGGITFESGCTLGLEDTEPTKRELRKFRKQWAKSESEQEVRDNLSEAHVDESYIGFDPDDSPSF